MRDWKKIGKKLLFPPVWIIVLLTVICTAALAAIFFSGWEMNPFAYVSYVLSFYTLIVICIFCWQVLPGFYKNAKSKLHENKYIDRYMTDAVFKSNVGLYRSLAINLIYVVVNAVSGYVYQTYWFGIFAVYYAIIAMMRFLLVRYVIKNPIGYKSGKNGKCIVFHAVFGDRHVCTIWGGYIYGSKKAYDNTHRSRDQCGGCHNGNLYDCTDDQRN